MLLAPERERHRLDDITGAASGPRTREQSRLDRVTVQLGSFRSMGEWLPPQRHTPHSPWDFDDSDPPHRSSLWRMRSL